MQVIHALAVSKKGFALPEDAPAGFQARGPFWLLSRQASSCLSQSMASCAPATRWAGCGCPLLQALFRRCTEYEAEARPSMDEVLHELEALAHCL